MQGLNWKGCDGVLNSKFLKVRKKIILARAALFIFAPGGTLPQYATVDKNGAANTWLLE